jgi:hypothetical protein
MIICLFDFIVAPVLWSLFMAMYKGNVTEAWSPLTLQGAGLFHLSMGAILGVTAWSRGQEKMTLSSPPINRQSYARTPSRSTDEENYEERQFPSINREDR